MRYCDADMFCEASKFLHSSSDHIRKIQFQNPLFRMRRTGRSKLIPAFEVSKEILLILNLSVYNQLNELAAGWNVPLINR